MKFYFIKDYLMEFVGHDGQFTKGNNETIGIWSSYPPDFVSNLNGFSDQVRVWNIRHLRICF